MTIGEIYESIVSRLGTIYESREASSVADLIMESRLGLTRVDRLLQRNVPLSEPQETQLRADLAALLQNRPVQYVLGEAWFDGLLLKVNEHVLVPRPETEELIHWIVEDMHPSAPLILDVGTGSGNIPIALKQRLPASEVHTVDISPGAISLAGSNAEGQGTALHFHEIDFLDEATWTELPDPDVLVSNPPYIAESEKGDMHPRVLTYEPHLALFVPDGDPLLFFRKIARFASLRLNRGGAVYLEINEALGPSTKALLEGEGFSEVVLRKDMQGKDRMIRARLKTK